MPPSLDTHCSNRSRFCGSALPLRLAKVRSGRALVELLVSTLLLSVAAAATLSLLQLTLAASTRISDLTQARDLARDLAEQTVVTPCAAAAGAVTRARINAHWSPSTVQQSVNLSLSISFLPHAVGIAPPRSLNAVLAGWCA